MIFTVFFYYQMLTRSQKRKFDEIDIEEIQERSDTESDIDSDIDSDTEYTENPGVDKLTQFLQSVYSTYQQDQGQDQGQDQDDDSNDCKSQFKNTFNKIVSGKFFQFKTGFDNITESDNTQLNEIREYCKNTSPSIHDIIRLDCNIQQKQELLELLFNLENAELFTPEYYAYLKCIKDNIYELSKPPNPELDILEEQIKKKAMSSSQDSFKTRILKSDLSFDNKIIAYQKFKIMESYKSSDENIKYKNWLETLLSIPFGVYNNIPVNFIHSSDSEISKYLLSIRNILDENLSYLENPKDQIINVVSRMIRNPQTSINSLGLYGGPGLGKCFSKNTPILMFDGTIKMVQDIKIGDSLMGDDSTPRNVLTLGGGRDTMYKITNTRGETYTVNSEHILCLKYSVDKHITRNSKNKYFKVKWFKGNMKNIKRFHYNETNSSVVLKKAKQYMNDLTEDHIFEITVKEYLELSDTFKSELKGYSVPIDFPEKELNFDPYILGLYIGYNSSDDPKTFKNYSTIMNNYKTGKTQHVKDWSNEQFTAELKNQNLVNNKHIPMIYKCNSRNNRLKLLAGILDSNSSFNQDSYSYEFHKSPRHKQLIDDVVYLARSLGFACYKNNVVEKSKKVCQISISGELIADIPVCCQIKKDNPRQPTEGALVSDITVEELHEDNYYGFMIDGNKRFLLGNFIVTHNTAIVKSVAKALNRPLRVISLGGESDSSNLNGHNFTYIGSGPGRIIEILKETQTMSPVILFDELDKLSDSEKAKEIIATLIHLTDPSSNNKYNLDKYYSGIDFDLSNVLFVFTYNDHTKIDKILADRLFQIKVDNYTFKEKLEITQTHLIKSVLLNLNINDISFSPDAIAYLVQSSNNDSGMRTIKSKIEIVLSRINTLLLTDTSVVKLDYKKLSSYYKTNKVILRDHIDILLDNSIITKQNDYPTFMYI